MSKGCLVIFLSFFCFMLLSSCEDVVNILHKKVLLLAYPRHLLMWGLGAFWKLMDVSAPQENEFAITH